MARSSGEVMKPRTRVGARADVDGRDGHRRVLAARVLPDVEGPDGLQPRDDDQQVDHQRQDGAADEQVGEFHRSVVLRFGRELELRGEPVVDHRRLAVAQFEDAGADDRLSFLQPAGDGDEVAALLAEPHELLAEHLLPFPCVPSTTTKTESPYGA